MSVSDYDRSDGPQLLLNLTTHQLQYLVAVSRSETLGDAAERLHVSQSALSQGLTELERKLGVDLFERRGRNRVLTAQGQEVVAHADRILAATHDLTIWAAATASGTRGLVRLGLIDIAAVNYFPDTLMRFRTERPAIELRLTVAPSGDLVRQLIEGKLDAAVIVEPPPSVDRDADLQSHRDLSLLGLLTEELAIYAPVGSRLGGRSGQVGSPSSWGPWVTFPAESHTRRHIARALREVGADFRVEAESHQPEVLRQLVHLGMGWTVLPVLQAEAEPHPLVRARRRPLLTRRLVIARRQGSTIDPATAELLARLQQRAANPKS